MVERDFDLERPVLEELGRSRPGDLVVLIAAPEREEHKTVADQEKTRFCGVERVESAFTLAAADYNLVCLQRD